MHPDDDNALNTEERIWDLTMNINLKGVWWGSKYAILAMRENPTDDSKGLHTGGSIINTASFVALMGAATPQLACALHFILFPSLVIDNSVLQTLHRKEQSLRCHVSWPWSMPEKEYA